MKEGITPCVAYLYTKLLKAPEPKPKLYLSHSILLQNHFKEFRLWLVHIYMIIHVYTHMTITPVKGPYYLLVCYVLKP